MNAAIMIFDDVEVLDFCGPFEVLASARVPGNGSGRDRPRAFEVFTVALTTDIVTCRGGLLVQPNHSFATCPPVDVLVVPGGKGVLVAQEEPQTVAWLRSVAQRARVTASVCTGAFLLARTGLLDGHPATTHWAEINALREQYRHVDVREEYRLVDLGEVITSAGVSAGLDMSLYLLEKLHGRQVAEEAARGMEYRWEPVRTLVM